MSPPGCSSAIITHSGTENDAALSHLVTVKKISSWGGKKRKLLSLHPSRLEIAGTVPHCIKYPPFTYVSSFLTAHVTYGKKS